MPKKVPNFVILEGDVPEDDDNGLVVYHNLDTARRELRADMRRDSAEGDSFTIYELVPVYRFEYPEHPAILELKL